MKYILKFRWLITVFVLISIVLLAIFSPSLTELANEKGQIKAPTTSSSQKYNSVLESAGEDNNKITSLISLKEPLNKETEKEINQYVAKLKKMDDVKKVTEPFSSKEVKDEVLSKDKKHVLIPIETSSKEDSAKRVANKMKSMNQSFGDIHITGDSIINDDINKSTEKGLKTTEVITLILIISILLVVFRSIVTPLIPLIIVGLSYIASQAVIAFLVRDFDFPVSIYIQSFLVAILFGIGTDYCILILNRFKEELGKGINKYEATIKSFNTAGKTILVAAITVLVGFIALFFVQFDLFKSAVGIAVSVLVLLIIIFTVLPLLMSIFGEKLFWPNKSIGGHRDNQLWARLGRFSIKRPTLMLLVTVIIMGISIVISKQSISYDSTDEISEEYDSIKTIELIKDNYGEGKAFPVNILIKSDKTLTTHDTLSDLETLSKSIEKINGVSKVNTVTRPTGETIKQLKLTNQLSSVNKNLEKSDNGLSRIGQGIEEINYEITPLTNENSIGQMMSSGNPTQMVTQITSQANTLSQSLEDLNSGIKEVQNGQNEINQYIGDMSKSNRINDSGIYLNDNIIESDDFNKTLDMYSYDNGKVLTINVELSSDPFSKESIHTLNEIKNVTQIQTNDTNLSNSQIEYGGVTSINSDLKEVIDNDMTMTIILISLFLFVILIVFMKSIIMPFYILASILITYYASLSLTNLIFVNIANYQGLSIVVPFFSFVLIMALGVDYAIFLLTRFNEEKEKGINEALIISMKKMGTVIFTAAIILIGTFAALYSSGALTLIQIATIVIIGLILYNILMLPIFIPSLLVTFGKGNWWPFKYK